MSLAIEDMAPVAADRYATTVYMAENGLAVVGFDQLKPLLKGCNCSSIRACGCKDYNPWGGVLSGDNSKTGTGPSPLL